MTIPLASQESWMGEEATAVANLVSVIIPNYNHATYLPHAIDSVLRQTYQPFEIIVVDDGSTDHSRQVAAAYGDRIRSLWQENQGLSAARNTGLRIAYGEYIALLDADDMLESTFMTDLVSLLADNPAADGVICGYRFVDDNNLPLPQSEARDLPPETLYNVLLDGNFLVPESLLLHRRCYAAAGPFDETLRACEDWDMWLRVSRDFHILSAPHLLTRHRVLPGSMSSDPERMLTNRLVVLGRHVGSEPQDANDGEPSRRRAYARAYLTSAAEYLQIRDLTRAADCLVDMARIAPAMLTELDTFYELALGDQPKGRRGDFASLNLASSEQAMATLLTHLFAASAAAVPYRPHAYAQAHYALALLYYGAQQPAQARRHMIRSFSYRPQQAEGRQWRMTLVKSLVPAHLVQLFRPKQVEN